MDNNWKRRDVIGMGGAAVLAAAGFDVRAEPPPAVTDTAGQAGTGESDPERNMRLLREHRAASQRHSLPSALPGEEHDFDLKTQLPLVGFTPKTVLPSNHSPFLPSTATPAARALIGSGFASQALGPTFLSYGPMLAEGNHVIEEWESQIYGANGTLYNNQYLWILSFEGDQVVTMHEYNDTQHAAIAFGKLGKWPEL